MSEEWREAFVRGRTAHPRLPLKEEVFRRVWECAREQNGVESDADVEGAKFADRTSVSRMAPADLYLACACAEGVAGAAATFEEQYAPIINRAVARVLASAADREEAAQRTRQALLVGDGRAAPKIGKYSGRGPLENWVAVTAIRVAVSMGRSDTAERRLRAAAAVDAAGPDPELLYMKGELRQAFESAVADALQQLEDRERLVLRLYLVSGMTLEAIGKTFGVTQPSVSRWLAKAREDVIASVERSLERQFQASRNDLVVLAQMVASQLDISISRILTAVA
jgi:RNA polymerase sigma-70 factor (ECF subfamily)